MHQCLMLSAGPFILHLNLYSIACSLYTFIRMHLHLRIRKHIDRYIYEYIVMDI